MNVCLPQKSSDGQGVGVPGPYHPAAVARAHKALVVVIVCAFALRWLAWIYARDLECFGDECTYFRFARDLAEGGVFSRRLRWPPGSVAFLAAHIAFGLGAAGARFTQVLL